MIKHRLRFLLAVPIIAALATSCIGYDYARSIQLVNIERESRGVAVVLNNVTLQAKAQSWADVLAQQGQLVHSNLAEGVGGGWSALGENLAMADSIEEAHNLLMNSASHRSTMLSSRYKYIGVGVAFNGGRYYIVQVFGG